VKDDTGYLVTEEKGFDIEVLSLELVSRSLARAAFGPIVGLPKTCSHFFRFQPIAAREVIAVIVRLAIAVISSVALRIDHSIVSMKPIGAIMRVPLERRTV